MCPFRVGEQEDLGSECIAHLGGGVTRLEGNNGLYITIFQRTSSTVGLQTKHRWNPPE